MKKNIFSTGVMKRIHFLGIGGSGVNAIATLAKEQKYEVSGCDVNQETAYTEKLHKLGIETFLGHSKEHLKDIDILVVTPAIFFMNQDNEEVTYAKANNIPVLSWQEFLGKYLLSDKRTICVSGTHGKSTTTALLSLVLEKAGLDPSAVVGAKIPSWHGNSRNGEGEIFVVESDEFNNNFLHYNPETIILNNIEFDHPDFFESEDAVLESFYEFVKKLTGSKNLIFNQDSKGIEKLFEKLGDKNLEGLNLVGYTLGNETINLENSTKAKILNTNNEFTEFEITYPDNQKENYKLKIPGEHNVSNALGVILAAKLYEVEKEYVDSVFLEFEGIGRRLELIGEKSGIKVFDDYAHHPTAVKATIKGLRQKYPNKKIWVIMEAHGYKRTKFLLPQYEGVFDEADGVIIGPIFKARDAENFGVSEKSIVDVSQHKNISYKQNLNEIIEDLLNDVKDGDVILIMGAGESYIWAREIFNKIK